MPALPLRTDFDAKSCRLAAMHAGDASQARRLLSIAAIYDGASRGEAATLGSVTVQIVCDWVKKFNAHGPEGLINRKHPIGLTVTHKLIAYYDPPLHSRSQGLRGERIHAKERLFLVVGRGGGRGSRQALRRLSDKSSDRAMCGPELVSCYAGGAPSQCG
jgi:hypothetical protein